MISKASLTRRLFISRKEKSKIVKKLLTLIAGSKIILLVKESQSQNIDRRRMRQWHDWSMS